MKVGEIYSMVDSKYYIEILMIINGVTENFHFEVQEIKGRIFHYDIQPFETTVPIQRLKLDTKLANNLEEFKILCAEEFI